MTLILYDEACRQHLAGVQHPESALRLETIVTALREEGLWDRAQHAGPRDARLDEICLVHLRSHIETIGQLSRTGGAFDEDTPVSPGSWQAVHRAVGQVLEGIDRITDGRARNAFAAVRPPGHHALPDRSMGFCLVNNVAIAARYLQQRHGVERVLILDWDIHHGNGTQDIFYDDPSVMYISSHATPFYPDTGRAEERGEGPGEGTTLNLPLPCGAPSEQVIGAVREALAGPAWDFAPDFVLVSAGFDGAAGDPLGCFDLTADDFATLTRLCMALADACCDGRLLSVLEGGYNMDRLGECAAAHVRTLMESEQGDAA